MKVVVGVPAYNEQAHISGVIHGCKKYADKILVYDDGSRDLIAGMARDAGAQLVSRRHMSYGARALAVSTLAATKLLRASH